MKLSRNVSLAGEMVQEQGIKESTIFMMEQQVSDLSLEATRGDQSADK